MEQRCSNIQRHLEPVHPTSVKWPYPNNPYPSRTHEIVGSKAQNSPILQSKALEKLKVKPMNLRKVTQQKLPKNVVKWRFFFKRLDPTPPDPTTKKTKSPNNHSSWPSSETFVFVAEGDFSRFFLYRNTIIYFIIFLVQAMSPGTSLSVPTMPKSNCVPFRTSQRNSLQIVLVAVKKNKMVTLFHVDVTVVGDLE